MIAVPFNGFGDAAFEFFEQVQSRPSWPAVQSLSGSWERHVHAPMEALLDRLGPEFGRDAYAYHLHRDPYLWSHQVGIITVADTIGYRLVLSLEGLTAHAGWMRSSADQVQRYREAVASEAGQQAEKLLVRMQEHGFTVEGQQLARAPRGWPADHPRIDLLRYRTLYASRQIPADELASGAACTRATAAALRQVRPLADWLAEYVGPRQDTRLRSK